MPGSQKKIIVGKSFLFPDDAIVEVFVCVFSPWHEVTKITYWHFGTTCSLVVSHANFSKKSRRFELFRTELKTEERVAPDDRTEMVGRSHSDEFRVMHLPGVVKAMDAVFSTSPALTDFVINEYVQGEVSGAKTLEFFRACYNEKLATK